MKPFTSRARTTAAALAVLLALASCGTAASLSFPDRAPDAVGKLLSDGKAFPSGDERDDAVRVFTLVVDEVEYPYYADAVLFIDEDAVIGDQVGESLTLGDITAATVVEVWTGPCRESYPVQCDVTHVRLSTTD